MSEERILILEGDLFPKDHGVAIGGRFDGWLMWRHPDGQWVSIRKLREEDPFAAIPKTLNWRPENGDAEGRDETRHSGEGNGEMSDDYLDSQLRRASDAVDPKDAEIADLRRDNDSLAKQLSDMEDERDALARDKAMVAHFHAHGDKCREAVGFNSYTAHHLVPAEIRRIRARLTAMENAVDKIIAASRAYLPFDGISEKEFIGRVIEATDNQSFCVALKGTHSPCPPGDAEGRDEIRHNETEK